MTEFEQTKLECLATLRAAFHECFSLYTCLSESIHRCELAETEEQLEEIDRTILDTAKDFKHIEIMG